MNGVILFAIVFGIGTGIILLQLHLSKKERKWPGLVLPIISFCFSLLYVANVQDTGDLWGMLRTLFIAFFAGNIPTIILLAMYAGCRRIRN
jgi:hypothetical protein